MMTPYELAFTHAPIGLMITRNRVIEICNDQFCEMFGYLRDELEGHSLAKLYPSDGEFQRMGDIGVSRLRDRRQSDDFRIMMRKGGELFWVKGRCYSLTPDEPFAHIIWSFEDMSALRPIIELSPRERQVAMLVTEGKSAKEIARFLDISPRTVEAHRARLQEKYGAKTTAELIVKLSAMPI